MRIEELEVRVYRIPTDGPEEDGTFHWESTTMVLVEAVAEGGQRGLGYSYASAAAGTLIEERLGPAVVECDVEDVGAAWKQWSARCAISGDRDCLACDLSCRCRIVGSQSACSQNSSLPNAGSLP